MKKFLQCLEEHKESLYEELMYTDVKTHKDIQRIKNKYIKLTGSTMMYVNTKTRESRVVKVKKAHDFYVLLEYHQYAPNNESCISLCVMYSSILEGYERIVMPE